MLGSSARSRHVLRIALPVLLVLQVSAIVMLGGGADSTALVDDAPDSAPTPQAWSSDERASTITAIEARPNGAPVEVGSVAQTETASTVPSPGPAVPGTLLSRAGTAVVPRASTTTTSTTAVPATSTTAATPTTTSSTTSTTVAPMPSAQSARCCADWAVAPYEGVGAWVDVYDWTLEHTNGRPSVTAADIDAMASLGVRTIFIQTARTSTEADVSEPDRLRGLIDRAHANGMAAVGWYLPTFVDMDKDLRRLVAALDFDFDGFSVNIESNEVRDPAERSRRAVEVSRRFREHVPDGVVGTVVLNPFAMDELVPHAWPGFPWSELDPYFEVWQPMAYVTYRPADDEWRDTEAYTTKSIEYQRRHTGGEPVSVATGIADRMTVADIEGFTRAVVAEGAIGGSIYDWATATRGMWEAARPINAPPD